MSELDLPSDISKFTGPLLIGHLLQWGLFGVLSVQVYIYYLAFPKDPPIRKILVYGVYAAGLTQTILYSKMAFKAFASGFGNFEALSQTGNFWFASPIMSSTVAFTVQIFYAYEIKVLAKSNFITMVIVLFALVQLGGGIGVGVAVYQFPLLSEIVKRKTLILGGIWNAGSAVCDIIIAASMTYYLSRSKTTRKPTQRMIEKLVFFTVGTGALTATITIIGFILYMLPSHLPYYVTTTGILGKMYSTTMMVALNSRIVLQAQDESIMLDEHLSSSTSVSNPGISRWPTFCTFHGGSISVAREQRTDPFEVYKTRGTEGLGADSDSSVHTASKA